MKIGIDIDGVLTDVELFDHSMEALNYFDHSLDAVNFLKDKAV